ncbi:MAG: succinate dehydrogenase, cytochrome b556 subunit [Alphaproteobacteria bacterium]|nr:MAG: succinate dehydrogenase, cytochrome b556 subunit [Alphaproteobacteria bacterium]
MMRPHRNHPLWFAFVLHRVSGLALALFLPVHFYMLALALRAPERLDGFLRWAELPLVRLAEGGLVFLLAVHLFGGLRLLALEFLPFSPRQKALAAGAVSAAVLVSGLFLLSAV